MLKSKNISLLFMALATVVSLFAAIQAEATCLQGEIAALTCLDTGGYELRVATTPFPTQNSDGSTTFTYTATPLPGTSKNISTLDMLVPVCNSDFNSDGIVDNLITVSSGDANGWRQYPAGQGSSNTNYGLGVTQYTVFENSFNIAGQFYLHTTKAVSGATSVGLKVGSQLFYGSILGPVCFQGKVATTTNQVIQIDPFIPEKTVTVQKNSDGSFAQDSSSLSDSEVWACSNPILNSDGSYAGCNDPLTQLTYVSDSCILKFGKQSMVKVSGTSAGTPTLTCYCCQIVNGKYSCPLVGCNTYCP